MAINIFKYSKNRSEEIFSFYTFQNMYGCGSTLTLPNSTVVLDSWTFLSDYFVFRSEEKTFSRICNLIHHSCLPACFYCCADSKFKCLMLSLLLLAESTNTVRVNHINIYTFLLSYVPLVGFQLLWGVFSDSEHLIRFIFISFLTFSLTVLQIRISTRK